MTNTISNSYNHENEKVQITNLCKIYNLICLNITMLICEPNTLLFFLNFHKSENFFIFFNTRLLFNSM
jgi:hypothetical protein